MAKIAPDVLSLISRFGVTPEQAKEVFTQLMETQKEIKRLDVLRDCTLAEIERKYDLYHSVFDKIFAERKTANDKFFHLIDEGIRTKDKELIGKGVDGLATIVTHSPFKDVAELRKLIDTNQKIEL